MFLRVIFISITVCLTSSISNTVSNAVTLDHENRESISIKKRDDSNLIILNSKLILSRKLQIELALEIMQKQKSIERSNNFLANNTNRKIGLVYMHQGQENWSLHFTYAGYLLNTREKMIITTSEIFELKQIFANTESLEIIDREYQTTRYMNQLGAILHES